MSVRHTVLLAALVAGALTVPATSATAAATVVVDADGAASAASCDAPDRAPRTVSAALSGLTDGATVLVCPGVVTEPSQVVLAADVTVAGTDPTSPPTIRAGADTGSSGDDRGWWLVRAGADVRLRDLHLDGSGRDLHQALRFRGQGTVERVEFTDIAYNATGPDHSGFGVVAFGDGPVVVEGSTFRRMGRVGALFFGPDVTGSRFSGNTYIGKGSGDHLDYGVELGQGAEVRIVGNTIARARGTAQGAVSAGVLLSTAFGGGVGATITRNVLTNNANGVFVDDSAGAGLGAVSVTRNALSGSTVLGVAISGGTRLDAACNWWGTGDGPRTSGGSGDGASAAATVQPFLTTDALDGRCASDPEITSDTSAITVDEGDEVAVTGTYAAGTVGEVSLAASAGEITKTGSNQGTWTWRHAPDDGPSGSTVVTFTAANERQASIEVDLAVRNVAPSATFSAPSTAFTERTFRISLHDASDPSAVDRGAGLTFAFDCGDGAGYGEFGSATSVDCTLARAGRHTVRAAVRDRDDDVREYSSGVEVNDADGDGSPDRSASGEVGPGESVSTGEGEATPSDPVTTSVRTPIGGRITIEEGPPQGPAPADHRLLIWGARITAPVADADRPLEVVLRLDGDLLPPPVPGTGIPLVVPVRDGDVVLPCRERGGGAGPDPCVAARTVDGDDLVIAVRSTSAGAFDLAEPTAACPAVGVPRAPFDDVAGNVHAAAVDCAVWWELAQGLSGATFAPHRTVTRAQVATTVANLLALAGVDLPADPPDRFGDDDGSVHERAIGQVVAVGVMRGTTETTFAPQGELTRGQLATVLAGAYEAIVGEPLPDAADRFSDDDGSIHEANIDRVAAAGLATGLDRSRFGPHLPVRRDQTASLLTRLLAAWYADVLT